MNNTLIKEIHEDYLLYKTNIQDLFEYFSISKNQKKYLKIDESKKRITFHYPTKKIETSFHPVEILFEDETLIVANKPSFLLVHSDGNGNDTLQARVNGYLQLKGYSLWAQAIHRIDYETSGLVLFCKHPFFQSYYDKKMEFHNIQKTYIAIVNKNTNYKNKKVTSYISRNRHDAKKMITTSKGKECISIFNTLLNFGKYSLLRVEIKTGRKHQIRVQCQSLKHPIINDPLYGKRINDEGLYLQSYCIKIDDLEFICPKEKRFQKFIKSHNK